MKLPTATTKNHRVASADAPGIDGESIVCSNEPTSLVTSRAAYWHCQQSRSRRVESTKQTAATTKSHASSVSRRHRYRWREARLAAPSCRVSARHMRRVGNASKRRRRVANIKPPTATMTTHRVAFADAPSRRREHRLQQRAVEPRHVSGGVPAFPAIAADELRTQSKPRRRRRAAPAASSDATAIGSKSMACSLKLSSLLTQRAAGWQCQPSPPPRPAHEAAKGDDEDPHE